jgi:hypothetical protein
LFPTLYAKGGAAAGASTRGGFSASFAVSLGAMKKDSDLIPFFGALMKSSATRDDVGSIDLAAMEI